VLPSRRAKNIQGMKYIESKNGNKMKNIYNNKIITIINQIESKYGLLFFIYFETHIQA
jgi:hypothetical protein